jgi:hypothetical protein
MGRRRSSPEVLWDEGPEAFSFLVPAGRFEGPEILADGLEYRRADLVVAVTTWAWKGEVGFSTSLQRIPGSPGASHAELHCLYVACGLGPVQDVPTGAGASHVIVKRVQQHAAALRAVLPHLEGPQAADLFRRCQGQDLPL